MNPRRHRRSREWSVIAGCVSTLLVAGSSLIMAPGDGQAQALSAGSYTKDWNPATWWFRLRTTTYNLQTTPAGGTESDHFLFYQHYDGTIANLASGRIKLRLGGRVANSVADDGELPVGGSAWQVGYAEVWAHRTLAFRLGRTFLQEGVTGLTLDGLAAVWRYNGFWDVRLWAGARAPYDLDYSFGSLDSSTVVGGRFMVTPRFNGRRARVSLSYMYRERLGMVAFRPLGLELDLSPTAAIRLRGRTSYDLEQEKMAKTDILLQWLINPEWVVSGQFLNRLPVVDAASYFIRFVPFERITLSRATVRYERPSRLGGEFGYLGTWVDGQAWTRMTLAFLYPYGRIGAITRFGYAGEEVGAFGDFYIHALTWLRVGVGANYWEYALVENAPSEDTRELTTVFARAELKLRPGMDFIVEFQGLENPLYSEDFRILAGLDLTMGRGSSRLGLDRGGWFR